jgi:hypothetical protein
LVRLPGNRRVVRQHALLHVGCPAPPGPPRRLSLDQALEFVREDEAVEVTPHAIRLRKAELDVVARQKRARALARAG